MGINFAYARKKFSEAQQKLRKEYKAAGMTDEQILEMYEYSLDFEVTPHQLRHTYITNLIYASVDPKTVQYLAGHENSKITMDIYAKAKYNRPKDVAPMLEHVFYQWNEATTK